MSKRSKVSIVACVLIGVLLLGVMVSAGVKGSDAPTSNVQPPTTKWDLGQKELNPIAPVVDPDVKDEPVLVTILSFIFKLAIVVALAYGTICLLKRFNGLKNTVGGNRHQIRVVENTSLGTNRTLHLVDVGSKRLLVASTPGQISLLAELEANEKVDSRQCTVDSREGDSPAGTVNCQLSTVDSPQDFKDQLSSFLGAKLDTGDANKNVAQAIRGSSTFLQEKIMELGRLRRKLKDA